MALLTNFCFSFTPNKIYHYGLRSAFSSGSRTNGKNRYRETSVPSLKDCASFPTTVINDDIHSSTDAESDDGKFVKRKVAMIFSYVGSAYNGLQIDTTFTFKTVESEIQKALFEVGCIKPSNFNDLTKISWSRSSRVSK